MSSPRTRLRPLYIPDRKHADFEQSPRLGGGHLSPDLQPNTPPVLLDVNNDCHCQAVSQVGDFLLLEQLDAVGNIHIHRSLHSETKEEFICKVSLVSYYSI